MDSYLESLVKKTEVDSIVEEAEQVEEVAEFDEAEPVEEVVDTSAEKEDEEAVTHVKAEQAKELVKEANNHADFIQVSDIRVYNVPDENSPVRIISGNIVKLEDLAGFTRIQYVKPGFGLVIGYTKDI